MKHTVSELELTNGAKGLLVHVPDASVLTLEVNFRAGEYLVEHDKWEAPHLMEHVLLGANKQAAVSPVLKEINDIIANTVVKPALGGEKSAEDALKEGQDKAQQALDDFFK